MSRADDISPLEHNSPLTFPHSSSSHQSSHSPTDAVNFDGKHASPPVNGVNGTSSLNARSCVTCRKRKVKCDKRHPCSNCTKASIECVFPGPGRAPRRSRKPADTELLARLRRLEGVVQSLGKGIDEDGDKDGDKDGEMDTELAETKQDPPPQPGQQNGGDSARPKSSCQKHLEDGPYVQKKAGKESAPLVKEFGRLVVEDGRSRYVSNKFWNSLSEEVAEMRDILDDPTEDEDDYPSPGSGSSAAANHQGFLFNFSSTVLDLRVFHPRPEHIPTYWHMFKENVDPVIKLFHIPHYEKLYFKAARDMDHLSKPMEVLLFTVYFAAVTTISQEECSMRLGIERQAALQKYRFAVEQALARAGFLSTQELIILQCMLLFLTCVRRSDDTRYVWTLSGLLIRLAQALGVHRDGQQFKISPFETEMRRRLWWQICTLDVRASEDHGSDPSIIEQSFDTKFPLNINDEDLTVDMKEPPEEHEGATEMTFDLIRYSVSTTVRRLSYAPPGPGPCRTRSAGLSLEDKERMIEELHQYLERKYLRHCNCSIPLHWIAATVARLIMAKMWLIVHHPFSRADRGAGLPQETKDRLFSTSVEVIEFSRLLETEKTTLKWGWLFRTYVQWHALAFVVSQLCIRTLGPEVDRAWIAIESIFDDWGGDVSSNQRGMLWKPLRKLMAKARMERSKALQKQACFPLDGSLGPADTPLSLPPGPMSTVGGKNDFSDFGTTSMAAADGSFPASMVPDSFGADGMQQPFLPMDQSAQVEDLDSLSFDPTFFAQQRPIEDESMVWNGWDDIIQANQAESNDNVQGIKNGPVLDGVINWW